MGKFAIALTLIAFAVGGCKTFRNPTVIEHTTFDADGKRTGHFYYRGEKDVTLEIPARVFVPDAPPDAMAKISSKASPVILERGKASERLALAQAEVTRQALEGASIISEGIVKGAVEGALGVSAQRTAREQITADRDVELKKLEPVEAVHGEGEPKEPVIVE